MSFILFAFFFLHLVPSFGLNTDGVLLLSFKYSILSDPLSVLENWNYDDATPCSWTGVTCSQIDTTTIPGSPDMFRVTSLILPNSQLLGSVTKDLGLIQHLRHLDLSNNFFNGSLPLSIFNATELQVLSLSNNAISGELPDHIGQMPRLQLLNLSVNALAGKVPRNWTAVKSLTVVSLRSNYFSGSIPSGFTSVEVLDLSSNLFNGSLPLDFGGDNLRYLNLSYNKISGSISPEFAKRIPQNVTIDLSFNNLTGAIPGALPLVNQRMESFSGNVELCGKPLKNLCSIPSTLSTPPNVSTTTSPAIAVIPKSIDSVPVTNSSPAAATGAQNQRPGLKPGTIAAIAVADLAGIGLLAFIVFYVYQLKKRKALDKSVMDTSSSAKPEKKQPVEAVTTVAKTEHATWSCLKMIKGEETSDANTSSDSDQDGGNNEYEDHANVVQQQESKRGASGTLVTVDGETELEVETLFKASAYILGTSSSSIVYKAVLADGTTLAVRRIGETCFERLKDLESQVKAIAKLKHPNLVKLRGFYWGDEEKLLIHDYVSNGCLASFSFSKFSPFCSRFLFCSAC